MENSFCNDKYKQPPSTWSLKHKIYLCTVLGFGALLINQLLYVAAETEKVLYIAHECSRTNHNIVENYITEHLKHIFKLIPYNLFIGELRTKREIKLNGMFFYENESLLSLATLR